MGDKDDLEYNITFPSSGSGEGEPVVFLLGWLGSKDKLLAKYSSIYEQEGCITIRYIHSVKNIFFQDPFESKHHRLAAEKLVQLLDDYELSNNPVMVHVMSNGGYFVYHHLADVFCKRDVNVFGAVFDSCPSRVNLAVGAKALYYSGILSNIFLLVFAILAMGIVQTLITVRKWFSGSTSQDMFKIMTRSSEHMWPHLFLYSTADLIVPHKHIEEMARGRELSKALFVRLHNFETSPHVLHYKSFPEIYSEKCKQFLYDCLEITEGNSVANVASE